MEQPALEGAYALYEPFPEMPELRKRLGRLGRKAADAISNGRLWEISFGYGLGHISTTDFGLRTEDGRVWHEGVCYRQHWANGDVGCTLFVFPHDPEESALIYTQYRVDREAIGLLARFLIAFLESGQLPDCSSYPSHTNLEYGRPN